MALPGDVTTFDLHFGDDVEGYTDVTGAVTLLGAEGIVYPIDLATGKRLNLVHVATGQAILPADVEFTLDDGGKAKAIVSDLPHTDNPSLSVVGFGYQVEWKLASGPRHVTPGKKRFAVPTASGASVDYDLLDVAEAVPGVLVPMGVSSGVADAAVAALLPGPSLAATALDGRYVRDSELGAQAVADATVNAAFAHPGGAETFVAKDDMKATGLVVAAAGDSSSDEISEWMWRGVGKWLADRPDISATGYYGFGESGPYIGPTDMQVSGGGYWQPFYRDEFARTGDVYLSTPDLGLPYGGAAGGWTMDGAKAVTGPTIGNSAAQDADFTIPGGRRRVSLEIAFDTTPGATTEKALSLFIGQNSSNRVQLRLSVTTGGTQIWIINKVVAGAVTLLATGSGSPLTASALNNVTVTLEINTTGAVTATVGASQVTGTLTSPEIAAIVTAGARIYFQTSGANSAGAISIYRAQADKFITSSRTLKFYNGSRAGSVAQYAIDRLASLYPEPVDVLFINYGHNYGAGTVTDFLAALDALCVAFRAAHPESGIVLCSQNPEFSPAGNIAAHLARNAAVRRYAAVKGYGYLPVGELYATQTDGGQSWVQSDGIHPKRSTDTADPANGSYQAAVLLRGYLNGMSKQSTASA